MFRAFLTPIPIKDERREKRPYTAAGEVGWEHVEQLTDQGDTTLGHGVPPLEIFKKRKRN